MRVLFILAVLFLSAPQASAHSIGQDIVECLYQSGINADSPNFWKAIEACEKLSIERQESRNQYQQDLYDKAVIKVQACLHYGAWELDDGISPAGDIARALSLRCRPHLNELLEIGGAGMYKGTELSDQELERIALVFVLERRSASRK